MACLGKARFKGDSGRRYQFKVFPLGTRFRKVSGVYLIACRAHASDGVQRHRILYVGHTDDFSKPMDDHRTIQSLERLGANCICVQSDKSENSRREKKQDLLTTFTPVGNGKH